MERVKASLKLANFFIFIFAGILLPYVCWHSYFRGSTRSFFSASIFELRRSTAQQDSPLIFRQKHRSLNV